MSRRHRWWAFTFTVLVGLVLAGGLASWLLVRAYGPVLARDRVEAALAEALGRPVRVDRVLLQPWLARVSVVGMAVAAGPTWTEGAMLEVGRADLSLGLSSLWRRELVLSVTLQDLDLRSGPREEPMVPTGPVLIPERVAVGPVIARIVRVDLRRGRVRYEDPRGPHEIELQGVGASVWPQAGGADLSLQVEALRIAMPGVREVLERLSGTARLRPEAAAIPELTLRWEGRELRLTGDVTRPWADPVLALRVQGDMALAPVGRRLGTDLAVTGVARLNATVDGPASAPGISARVAIAHLGVGPLSARNLAIGAGWRDGTLQVDDLRGEAFGGTMEGALTMAPARPADTTVRVRVEGAALGALEALAGTSLGLGGRVRIEAAAEGDLRRLAAIRGRVRAESVDLMLAGALAPLGPGMVRAEARLANGVVEVSEGTAHWPALGIAVSGRAALDGPIELRSRLTADLARLGASAGWGVLDGQAAVRAEATGSWDAPQVAGRLETTPLAVAGQSVERIDARFWLTGRAMGTPARRHWAGTVESARVALPAWSLEDLQAALTLTSERLEVTRLEARAHGLPVRAEGTWSWAGSGRVHAVAGPVMLGRLPGVPDALALRGTGRAEVDATIRGPDVSGSGTVFLDGVAVAGVALGRGTGRIEFRSRAVQAELVFPERRLTGTAQGRLEAGGVVTARAALEEQALGPLVRPLVPQGTRAVEGSLSARAEVSMPVGEPQAFRGTVRVDPLRLVLAGETWESRAPVELAWQDGRLRLDRLRLESRAGTLTASGLLGGAGAKAELRARLDGGTFAALEALAGTSLGLTGHLTVEAELEGDLGRITTTQGRLRVKSADATLPGALAQLGKGAVRAEARLASGVAEVTEAEGRWPGMRVELGGRAALDGPIELRSRLTADLERIARAGGGPAMAGHATVTAEATGPWKGPRLSGRLEVAPLVVGGETIDRLEVPFALAGTTLRVERAVASVGPDRLTAAGTARWTGAAWHGAGTLKTAKLVLRQAQLEDVRGTFTVTADRLEAPALEARVHGVPIRLEGAWAWTGSGWAHAAVGPLALTGVAGLPERLAPAGTGRGEIDATVRDGMVTASATIGLDGIVVAGVSLGTGSGRVALEGRAVKAELAFPEARLTGTAEGRLETGGTLTARLVLENLVLGPLLREWRPGSAASVDGTVSARIDVAMPYGEPRAMRGTARLEPLSVVVAGERWASRGPVELRWADGALRLTRLQLDGRGGRLTATGTLQAAGALDAQVQGRFPLATLPIFRPEVQEAGGHLDVTATVGGSAAAPIVTGEGIITDGRLLLRDYPEPLRDIRARFVASARGVRLLEAAALLGDGQLRAGGELALTGWQVGAYRATVTARQVAVRATDGLRTVWDADLELAGFAARALVSGEARLVRGAYTRDLSLLSMVTARGGGTAAEPESAIPLRIRVRLDDNMLVRTGQARVRVGGTVRLEGTTAAPVLFGTLEAREGQITVRGRRFTLVSGSTRFADPRRIDPILDVVATAKIREYDVTVRISGRSDDLAVRVSSTPPLPQEDLLALVAFGVTRAEFRQSGAGILAGEAAQLLVQDFLGVRPSDLGLVDVVEVETTGEHGGTLRVGRRLTDRALVVYSQSLANSGESGLRVEYQLAGPLLLTGERNLRGDFGTDLVLRLRFR